MRRCTIAWILAAPCFAGAGCGGSAWTARVCASYESGNCRGVDGAQPHKYTVKSAAVGPIQGTSDVIVKEPACRNGLGEIDVEVVDRDDLQVTLYCLSDAPAHSMTLQPPPQSPPAPAPSR